jgi:hypothetical protein
VPSLDWRKPHETPRLKILASCLGLTAALMLPAASPVSAQTPFSFAVLGDIPYGSTQLDLLPGRIGQINADSQVQLVSHLGDISSPINCSDSYYSRIKSEFGRFADPLVYTPGDNEWADCHRASVGKANPLNRLAAVRRVFFPTPGRTLGQNSAVVTAQSGYPENVHLVRSGVTIAAFHAVGSGNGLDPWTGLGFSSTTTGQRAEFNARVSADVSHIRSDRPLTSSTWLSFYGIANPVPNLFRYTIEGGSSMNGWLRVTVVSGSSVLSVQRVNFR